MRTITHVQFDHYERDTLAKAFVHIRIAFPGVDRNTPEWRESDIRHKSVAAKNEVVSRERLEGAERALVLLAMACEEQSSTEFMKGHLGVTGPHGAEMAERLAETREWQAREAREALEVIRDALAVCPHVEWDEDEAEVPA